MCQSFQYQCWTCAARTRQTEMSANQLTDLHVSTAASRWCCSTKRHQPGSTQYLNDGNSESSGGVTGPVHQQGITFWDYLRWMVPNICGGQTPALQGWEVMEELIQYRPLGNTHTHSHKDNLKSRLNLTDRRKPSHLVWSERKDSVRTVVCTNQVTAR